MTVSGINTRISLCCAAVLLLTGCGDTTSSTDTDASVAASTPTLPDWSGWWVVARGPGDTNLRDSEMLLPEARRLIDEARAPGANLGGGATYCVPTRFNGGTNGGGTDAVEFLLMPQRLTITNGNGLLRRIPMDGRPLRENPEPSNGGTSIGEWDGDALVIETIGLHADTTFPTPSAPNYPVIGEAVHVVERLQLNEQGQIVIDTELTAPQLLIEPIEFTTIYERDPDYVYRDHDVCVLNDRSIDPDTGFQRFDFTPPAGLPPPPN